MVNEAGNDVTHVWKNQPAELASVSLEDIRRKARTFEHRIRWRNLREYAAATLVVVAFAFYIWVYPSWIARTGCVLEIAGTLFVMHALHKRGSSRAVPAELALRPCIEFHRQELERQRDLLRGVWTWYLLPLVPGMAVFLLGLFTMALDQPGAATRHGQIATAFALTAAGCALVFVGVGQLNAWAVRKIQREIDALDADGGA